MGLIETVPKYLLRSRCESDASFDSVTLLSTE